MEKLIALDANTLQSLSDRPESIITQDIPFQIAVASHPDTPRNLLEILANSDTPEVAEAARLHANYAGELNSEYANSEVGFVRFVSLLHPLTPAEILQEGSQSVSWIERYAVVDNPATSTEIRQQLTQDGNRIVRAVARAKLAV